jgi:hypothetical protein
MNNCRVTIRPASDIARINVRSGPGTHHAVLSQLDVGLSGLVVQEVRPDERGQSVRSKVYQWFRITLPDGRSGWVRDDLVDVEGDCSAFGYGRLAQRVRAANLTRDLRPAPAPTPEDAAAMLRVQRAAFNITAGFEGGSYSAYQTYDRAIVSYGRFQFTLLGGALESVLERYLKNASGADADRLRTVYMLRIEAKDATLRNDAGLKDLLVRLGSDPLMQAAQDEHTIDAFWTTVQRMSSLPRGIKHPLSLAMLFDMHIQHGPTGAETQYVRPAEQSLAASPRSMLGVNGLNEEQLIRRVAQIRRDSLYAQAAARGLGGLRPRGDFWVRLIESEDWALQGDDAGEIEIKTGRKVQVRKP